MGFGGYILEKTTILPPSLFAKLPKMPCAEAEGQGLAMPLLVYGRLEISRMERL